MDRKYYSRPLAPTNKMSAPRNFTRQYLPDVYCRCIKQEYNKLLRTGNSTNYTGFTQSQRVSTILTQPNNQPSVHFGNAYIRNPTTAMEQTRRSTQILPLKNKMP